MKKLIYLSLILFSGCNCMLSQIPPQYIYAGAGCEATLPDYASIAHPTDNCKINSVTQFPLPGYLLSPTNMIVTVQLTATDASGNHSHRSFTVALLDTIPPIFPDTLFTSNDFDKMNALYSQADRIVKDKVLHFDTVFPYAELGIPLPQDSLFYIVREIRLKDDNPTVMRMWQK